MAKAGVLVRAERAAMKRMQQLGSAAVSQFEDLVDGAISMARSGQRTGKGAMRAIAAAQKRTDDISRRLAALKNAVQKSAGSKKKKKRVKRRKTARRASAKRAAATRAVRRTKAKAKRQVKRTARAAARKRRA